MVLLATVILVLRPTAERPSTPPTGGGAPTSAATPAPDTATDPSGASSGPGSASGLDAATDLAPGAVGVSVPGTALAFASEAGMTADLDRIVAMGARWVRFDVPWDHVQHASGAWHWEPYDRVVEAARARNLQVLGILGTVAAPYRPAGTDWTYGVNTEEQRAAFVRYAERTAARYAGQVRAWEVWNEPNVDQSWAPTPSTSAYAALLPEVAAAVRGACADCLVVAGGTGGATGPPDVDTLTWYTRLAASGALHSVDAVALHPYSDMYAGDQGEMSLTPALRDVLDRHGLERTPVWGTELGVPQAGDGAVSEEDAARLLQEAYRYWTDNAKRLGTGPLFWYTLRNGQDPHHNALYGLLRDDGTATLGYRYLERLGQALRASP